MSLIEYLMQFFNNLITIQDNISKGYSRQQLIALILGLNMCYITIR